MAIMWTSDYMSRKYSLHFCRKKKLTKKRERFTIGEKTEVG